MTTTSRTDGSKLTRRTLLGAAAASTLAAPAFAMHTPYTRSIVVGSLTRSYIAYVPSGTGPFPVLLEFHGGGSTAQNFQVNSQTEMAPGAASSIVVYLQGYENQWNVQGGYGNSATFANVDDIGFVAAVLGDLRNITDPDPTHVYALGFSDGGSLIYTIMAQAPQLVAACVTCCSVMWIPTTAVDPAVPVPVWIWHGGADTICPIAGGPTVEGTAPPVSQTVAFWQEVNAAAGPQTQGLFSGGATNAVFKSRTGAPVVQACVATAMGHHWASEAKGPTTLDGQNLGPLPSPPVASGATAAMLAWLFQFSQ
jgi:poly(3-hydroxybutyrate) depolymerase